MSCLARHVAGKAGWPRRCSLIAAVALVLVALAPGIARAAPPSPTFTSVTQVDGTTVRVAYSITTDSPLVTAQVEYAPSADLWCTSRGLGGVHATVPLAVPTSEFQLNGLLTGVPYCMRVTATNASGTGMSLWSVAIALPVFDPGIAPIKPGKGTSGNHPLCTQAHPKDKCSHGNGRQTAGGGEKVSHRGWPKITGVFWQVQKSPGRSFVGGELNDELLGHHGSDTITGKAGKDVIWGDWDPYDNNTWQKDRLDGGPGNDWIYSSHGTNTIDAGAGKDLIWAYYGKGTIDCGPGFDTLRIRLGGANRYTHRNCERIKNFCAYGTKAGNAGGCYKPGEDSSRRS